MPFQVNISGSSSLIDYLYPRLRKKIVRIACHNHQGREQATLSIDLAGPPGLVDFKLLQLEDYIEKLLSCYPEPPELKIEVSNTLYAEPLGIEEHFQNTFCPVPNLSIVPWHSQASGVQGQKTIFLNPGSAFGSGRHPSTRLSLSLLERGINRNTIAGRKTNMLDVGCGSGILGIGAILFGAEGVLGIETDPDAVRTAQQNVALNGFEDRIRIEWGSLEIVKETFAIIAANLVPAVAEKLLPEMVGFLEDNGLLVMAGFQKGLLPQVIKQLEEFDLTILETGKEQEWSGVIAASGISPRGISSS